MTRVIHTGDTHLGYRQYHVPERREDFLEAFRQVIEDAVAADVDAVVHAGDLFHDRRPSLADVLGAVEVLETLDDASIPFLAVVGNHEGKRDAQWLDLFASMGLATRLGSEPVSVGETAFYGLDFVPRSRRDDLALDLPDHDASHAALVTHGLVEPFDFGTWDLEPLLADATVDFEAVLLGDNHEPETARVDGTWLTYCGSTERASAAERDDRGYNIVTFDDEVGISRRGIDTREFAFVDVTLSEGEGVDRVRERVGQHDLEDAVLIVTVEGDGDPFAPAEIEEYAREAGALVARVTDHREHVEESDLEVNFADPDAAVRERIRELGLSDAARSLDETVRASEVADSNVADEVESRVRDFLDEADADAFAPAEDPPDADGAVSGGGPSDDAGDADRRPTGSTDGSVENASTDGSAEDEPPDGSVEADSEPDDAASGDGPGDAAPVATADADADNDGTDDQASVEDYL